MFLIDCKEIYDSWLRDTHMSNMSACRMRREWIRCVWDCWRFDMWLAGTVIPMCNKYLEQFGCYIDPL